MKSYVQKQHIQTLYNKNLNCYIIVAKKLLCVYKNGK